MSFTHFTFTDDYKTEFKSYVDKLYKSDITEVDNKKDMVEQLTESYFLHCGEVPDSVQLDRLSTWLLKGVEHEDKEYDVLTDRQLKRRRKEKEHSSAQIDELTPGMKEDGNSVNYAKPTASDGGNTQMQKVFVKFPNDSTDKRKYIGKVTSYKA